MKHQGHTIRVERENNVFQHLEVLKRNRHKRHVYQKFFVEGVRNINQMLSSGWEVESLCYCSERPLSRWAEELLEKRIAEKHVALSLPLMEKLSEREETSELLAIVKIPQGGLSRISCDKTPFVLLFDRPSSPGNLGSLIRSADAFGADGIVVTGHGVDIYDPQTIRASTGSFFHVPVVHVEGHHLLTAWFQELRSHHPSLQIIGTDENGDRTVSECDLTQPSIVMMGNETSGLSKALLELCDVTTKIPMTGSASSLNVACAGSIVMYEMIRQKGIGID